LNFKDIHWIRSIKLACPIKTLFQKEYYNFTNYQALMTLESCEKMDKERVDHCSDEEYKEVLAEEWWRDQEAKVEYEWLMHLVELNQ
jgi:hypothetical protein